MRGGYRQTKLKIPMFMLCYLSRRKAISMLAGPVVILVAATSGEMIGYVKHLLHTVQIGNECPTLQC